MQVLTEFVNRSGASTGEVRGRGTLGEGCKTLGRKGQVPYFRYASIEHLLCAVSSG